MKDVQEKPFIVTEIPYIDLSHKDKESFVLSLSPAVRESDYFLVIDMYSYADHTHPDGHVAWWQFALDDTLSLTVQIEIADGRIFVTIPGWDGPEKTWKNGGTFTGVNEDVLSLHVVLRRCSNRAIVFDDTIPVYLRASALEAALALQRNLLEDLDRPGVPSPPWYCFPKDYRVCLLTQTFSLPDAVGSFVLDMCKLFRRSGIPYNIYASGFDPILKPTVKPVHEFLADIRSTDVIFYNLSIFDEYFDAIKNLDCKKALYYHGITPSRFMRVYDAEFARYCGRAYEHLEGAAEFDALAANSRFSAEEMNAAVQRSRTSGSEARASIAGNTVPEIVTFPPVLDPGGWDAVEAEEEALAADETILLYVGRLSPNKKIEDLFALQSEYLKLDPHSSLVIVGKPQFAWYTAYLNHLLETAYSHVPVLFLQNMSQGRLKSVYAQSSAYVSMSEHEGFCLPLIEAMYFGKPVFAYAHPAVRETLGESGIVFFEKEMNLVAERIFHTLHHPEELKYVVETQGRRFRAICSEADGRAVWRLLERTVFGDARAV